MQDSILRNCNVKIKYINNRGMTYSFIVGVEKRQIGNNINQEKSELHNVK